MKLFLKVLKSHRADLTAQQFRTIRGQAIAGDIEGATKGLYGLLNKGAGE